MRIVKEAEERKNEILDVAERLFVTKGFDNTSTDDIISEIGIARGTLYYHFKTKTDILDAMTERMTKHLIEKADGIYRKKEIPVLQRLTIMMMALNVEGNLGQEVMEQIHKPQNALLHQKIQEGLLSGISPLLRGLIEEGMEQGICQTEYPLEAAEMAFLYSATVFDALDCHSEEEKNKKMTAFIYNLERILGMESGSMQAAVLPILQKNS